MEVVMAADVFKKTIVRRRQRVQAINLLGPQHQLGPGAATATDFQNSTILLDVRFDTRKIDSMGNADERGEAPETENRIGRIAFEKPAGPNALERSQLGIQFNILFQFNILIQSPFLLGFRMTTLTAIVKKMIALPQCFLNTRTQRGSNFLTLNRFMYPGRVRKNDDGQHV